MKRTEVYVPMAAGIVHRGGGVQEHVPNTAIEIDMQMVEKVFGNILHVRVHGEKGDAKH
jgi:hypothetical protein